MIGRRLGPYLIQEQVGQGGMAIVYRAYDQVSNRYVALKVLSGPQANDPYLHRLFQQELRVAAALTHPNIVPTYDVGNEEGVLFIAMRLVQGKTLGELASYGPMPTQQAIHLIRQVAAALEFAHGHQVIHRDVKPSNIMVEGDTAYLMDFGVAHVAGITRITRTGMSLGTPHYMAPEQITEHPDQPVDRRTDVYALGAVLYELLSGRPPFVREKDLAVLYAQVHDPVPPIGRAVPPEVESTVRRALSKSPIDRYPTAQAFADALAASIRGATAPQPSLPAVAPYSRFIPIGLAAGVLLLVTALLLVRPSAPPAAEGASRVVEASATSLAPTTELPFQESIAGGADGLTTSEAATPTASAGSSTTSHLVEEIAGGDEVSEGQPPPILAIETPTPAATRSPTSTSVPRPTPTLVEPSPTAEPTIRPTATIRPPSFGTGAQPPPPTATLRPFLVPG